MTITHDNDTINYYIVSLKHTTKQDACLKLWGQNDCGYFYSLERAAIHSSKEIAEYDNDSCFPVHTLKLKGIAASTKIIDTFYACVPNHYLTWEYLGLEWYRGRLRRKSI